MARTLSGFPAKTAARRQLKRILGVVVPRRGVVPISDQYSIGARPEPGRLAVMSSGADGFTGLERPRRDDALARHRNVLDLGILRRLDAVAERAFDVANRRHHALEVGRLQRRRMVRAFGVAVERQVLLDDAGAERDRCQRNLDAVGMIGIADRKLERGFASPPSPRGLHRRAGRDIRSCNAAG